MGWRSGFLSGNASRNPSTTTARAVMVSEQCGTSEVRGSLHLSDLDISVLYLKEQSDHHRKGRRLGKPHELPPEASASPAQPPTNRQDTR